MVPAGWQNEVIHNLRWSFMSLAFLNFSFLSLLLYWKPSKRGILWTCAAILPTAGLYTAFYTAACVGQLQNLCFGTMQNHLRFYILYSSKYTWDVGMIRLSAFVEIRMHPQANMNIKIIQFIHICCPTYTKQNAYQSEEDTISCCHSFSQMKVFTHATQPCVLAQPDKNLLQIWFSRYVSSCAALFWVDINDFHR